MPQSLLNRIHVLNYTESGHESLRHNFMRTIAPEVKAIEHTVEFMDGQDNRFIRSVRSFLKSSDSRCSTQRQELRAPSIRSSRGCAVC